MDEEKLKNLQALLQLLEKGEEILQPNMEEIGRLAEENPEKLLEIFKKRYKDVQWAKIPVILIAKKIH